MKQVSEVMNDFEKAQKAWKRESRESRWTIHYKDGVAVAATDLK